MKPEILHEINSQVGRARIFFQEKVFVESDIVLTPAAIGVAPRGLTSTGDPLFNRIWTFLGLPCLSLPIGIGSNGLPLGIQVVGPFGEDEQLLACSHLLVDNCQFPIV